MAGLAVTALACGWRIDVDSSVRFRPYYDQSSDLRLLPPMPKSLVLERECEIGDDEGYDEARDYKTTDPEI